MLSALAVSLLAGSVLAAPADLQRRACAGIHVFGARETTVSPGYGSAGTVVNAILGAHSGATAEAISYPACGGQSSCGGVSYANSVSQGVSAVTTAVNNYASQCPDAQIVLVGYSQGGQIFDDALCGGGDTAEGISSTASPLSSAALSQIKAAIFMGDPRHSPGEPFNVGTSTAGGFDARPNGFTCGDQGSKIQSYCDAADPYCSNGSDASVHQGYGSEYGQQALTFVNSKLS
ncbi:MAG: 1 carbohydrate esterase [Bogoriella megaspora]|nr:MAG: 1 carbohydrate esterase [Bogoriella megaspora]